MPERMEFAKAVEATVRSMSLRPLKLKQLEAVKSFVSGKDTLVILPTGYGKSVIYGVLPMVFDLMLGSKGSIVVVVTPLTALMLDQKERFSCAGLRVEFVGSAQDDETAIGEVLNGSVQLVYISPESILNNKKFRAMLQKEIYKEKLRALAIDEAHCVKLWGDAFRQAFAEIGTLRSILPSSVKVLALTATATKKTVDCIMERLSMKDPNIIGANADRSNIKYIVCPRISQRELSKMLANELLTEWTKVVKTVLFCRTLLNCAEVYTGIKRCLGKQITEPPGLPNIVEFRLINLFTAASTPEMRTKVLAEFSKENTNLRLVIATSAFGLGVDCPDIGRVINWGAPSTLEELVQESGRAGRDGRNADAILYFKKIGKHTTAAMENYGNNETECRRKLLLSHFIFCDNTNTVKACRCCDLCAPLCCCVDCMQMQQ